MNDSRLDAVPRPGISTFPIKHQILTIRLSLQPVFRFCRQIYTQPVQVIQKPMLEHLPYHLVMVDQLPQTVVVAIQTLLEDRHHQNPSQRHPRPTVLQIPIRCHMATQ